MSLPPASSKPMDPASIRARARQSLVDTMDDEDALPQVRRAAAEALLKDIAEDATVEPTLVDMSDAELIQVILDWKAAATPQNTTSPPKIADESAIFARPEVPRGTLAERLAASLSGVAEKDPLCQ